MVINKINSIKKLFFTSRDVSRVLGISEKSAVVTCTRYIKAGVLLRLKRNLYVNRQKWDFLSGNELFEVANILQVPSYISLTTAISYYGISTQVQQDYYESVCLNRSTTIELPGRTFNYSKISRELYFGFGRENRVFIAKPEKALLDAFYLQYLGRYRLDISALDFEKIDHDKIMELSQKYSHNFIIYLKRSFKK